MTPELLEEYLHGLEIRPEVLRGDRTGETWLPSELRAEILGDPEGRRILAEYVADELDLFDSVRVPRDAVFTARVAALAETREVVGVGTDPWLRTWILAFSYALALAVACSLLAGLAHTRSWTGGLHALLTH